MNMIKIECSHCSIEYKLAQKKYKNRRKQGQEKFFCSTSCMYDSRRFAKKNFVCKNPSCRKEFVDSRERKCCSRSCSVTVRNFVTKREKKVYRTRCKICNAYIGIIKRTLCDECKFKSQVENMTLQELWDKCSKASNYHSRLRGHSRKVYGDRRSCVVCGYDVYTEICHVKPVHEFPMSARVSEVNSIDNLVSLCPNHHKELDLGILPRTSLG